MEKAVYDVYDIMKIFDIGRTSAFKLMKICQKEMEAQGKTIIRGKVSADYVNAKYLYSPT